MAYSCSFDILRFCNTYNICPKKIVMPSKDACSKIIIHTHNDEKHIVFPAIKRWTHVKRHGMKPLFREIMRCTESVERGPVPIKDVSMIIDRFLTFQEVHTIGYGPILEVYKNNHENIRCRLKHGKGAPVEQVMIDPNTLRVYCVI